MTLIRDAEGMAFPDDFAAPSFSEALDDLIANPKGWEAEVWCDGEPPVMDGADLTRIAETLPSSFPEGEGIGLVVFPETYSEAEIAEMDRWQAKDQAFGFGYELSLLK